MRKTRDDNYDGYATSVSLPAEIQTFVVKIDTDVAPGNFYEDTILSEFLQTKRTKHINLVYAKGINSDVAWKTIVATSNTKGVLSVQSPGSIMKYISLNFGGVGNKFSIPGTVSELDKIFDGKRKLRVGFKGNKQYGSRIGVKVKITNNEIFAKHYSVLMIFEFTDYLP